MKYEVNSSTTRPATFVLLHLITPSGVAFLSRICLTSFSAGSCGPGELSENSLLSSSLVRSAKLDRCTLEKNTFSRKIPGGMKITRDLLAASWSSLIPGAGPRTALYLKKHMVEVQLVDSSESSSPTLHNARAKENDGDLRKLLSEDAAVNKDTEGIYPLFFPFQAVTRVSNARVVKLLLARPEARPDRASRRGRIPFLTFFFSLNKVSNDLAHLKSAIPLFCKDARCTPDILNSKNRDGKTALMEAVESGSLVPVVMLSKVKAVNWKIKNIGGEWGESLLEVAEEMAYNGENDNLKDRQQIRAIVEVKLGGKKSGISEDYYEDY